MSKVTVSLTNYSNVDGGVTSTASAHPTGNETKLRVFSNRVQTALEKYSGNAAPAAIKIEYKVLNDDDLMSEDYHRIVGDECRGIIIAEGVTPIETHLECYISGRRHNGIRTK